MGYNTVDQIYFSNDYLDSVNFFFFFPSPFVSDIIRYVQSELLD